MQFNHLNLCVENVAESQAFFETHFGFHCTKQKGEGRVAVLKDCSDFTLVLSNFDEAVRPVYPEAFHVGFLVDTVDEVLAIYDGLVRAGVCLQDKPRPIRGAIGFYGYAPSDILFEVSTRQAGAV